MNNCVIDKLKKEDAEAVALLEKKLIGTGNLQDILKTLNSDCLVYYVLKIEGKVVGFCEVSILPPEAELYDIAIDEGFQRQGLATKLLNYVLGQLKLKNCNTIFLEVNSINYSALEFYKKFNFTDYGKRKGYYGKYDAILLKKLL